ncbi:MAG: hypothetical protein II198_01015 [Bacteroidaceae bacterium]|jgi:hypothetical protein|nr:hypothetical protein [Bacteroidaceae bacterium]
MKKSFAILALAGMIIACGGNKNTNAGENNVSEDNNKSLPQLIYEAMKSGDPNYATLMEQLYQLPPAEYEKAMEELGKLSEADYGPEAG